MPFDLRLRHDRTSRDAVLDGAMRLFLEALETHRRELDSLNVFPVPDADTGSNLWLTQRGVVEALDHAVLEPNGGVADLIANAVLRSARGNSGVIVAQILMALVEDPAWADGGEGAGRSLALGLARASAQAAAAVAKPLDGTILSVLAEAAERAEAAVHRAGDEGDATDPGAEVGTVAEIALDGARMALARTVDVLPALRAAGVVDAGGLGLVLLLDAVHAAVANGPLTQAVGPLGPLGPLERRAVRPEPVDITRSVKAYEVQFVLRAPDCEVPRMRVRLAAMGDSLVVVGGGGTHAVHVHTDHPDEALAAGRATGTIEQESVVTLDDRSGSSETAARDADGRWPTGVGDQPAIVDTAIIAVADGDGVVEAFESLGAIVLRGDLVRSSGAGAFTHAIERIEGGVVLLPNDPELVPAAANAVGQFGGRATVVETATVLEGLAAAAAHNPELDPDADAPAMRSATAAVVSGALSQAGAEVRWVAALGGRSVATADTAVRAAEALVEHLTARVREPEIITVIVGAAGDDGVVNAIRTARRDLRVDVIHGGQPGPAYLIGAE
jgi:DAK2 domain fusion protein YloV